MNDEHYSFNKKVTKKANFKTDGEVTITIDVDKPVLLVQYALKSAND